MKERTKRRRKEGVKRKRETINDKVIKRKW